LADKDRDNVGGRGRGETHIIPSLVELIVCGVERILACPVRDI
jgi:hypothetical protein